jgi:hypothetical protein
VTKVLFTFRLKKSNAEKIENSPENTEKKSVKEELAQKLIASIALQGIFLCFLGCFLIFLCSCL